MSRRSGSTPKKGSLKRSNRMAESGSSKAYPNHPSPSKRKRENDADIDIDLSGIADDSQEDWNGDDLQKLFEHKFQEQSPSSKLGRSLSFVGLKESNLMKRPKLASSSGSRSIGLTAAERQRKRANRSLEYPSGYVGPSLTSPKKLRSSQQTHTRSPKK